MRLSKVWTEILKKIRGPNGPNRSTQHENLRLKHQNIGKRSTDIVLIYNIVFLEIFLSDHDF